jgi:hypothetical protein
MGRWMAQNLSEVIRSKQKDTIKAYNFYGKELFAENRTGTAYTNGTC